MKVFELVFKALLRPERTDVENKFRCSDRWYLIMKQTVHIIPRRGPAGRQARPRTVPSHRGRRPCEGARCHGTGVHAPGERGFAGGLRPPSLASLLWLGNSCVGH